MEHELSLTAKAGTAKIILDGVEIQDIVQELHYLCGELGTTTVAAIGLTLSIPLPN